MRDDAEVARILVITAHPDDVDFGMAGTVATWTDAGIEVVYCIVTNGEAGGSDPSVSRAEMVILRQAEQIAAAKCVGVSDVRFLGYPDGRLEASLDLRGDLARVIRQVRPDRVACPSPERNYARMPASHPDHRAAGSAALDAVYPDARNPFAFPELADEGLEPWIVPEVWISGGLQLTHFVDVTDTFDRKIAALRAHESQTSHMDNLGEMLR
ncbi:MAG TPA: PIG-L deacetylase family protein, partial [Streptosporangiaceae bacterium]|nr:PIG-L deacetylase family protein [Streptosporangiaceae bacterium]